jgi:ABC-type transporter Mla subunit MlaD
MPQNNARNRVLAGGFLLVAMAAGLSVLVVLGGWDTWFQETQIVKIRFRAAPNLRVGSPMLLAGHPVGRVEGIRLVEVAAATGVKNPMRYQVEIAGSLPKQFTIHKNGRVTMSQALVGTSASINIENVGTEGKIEDYLQGQETSMFADAADQLGIGEAQRDSIGAIIENVRVLSEEIKKKTPAVLDDIKQTSKNLVDGSEKIRQILDENRENVKTGIASARTTLEKVEKGADPILANVNDSTAKVKSILEKNEPVINDTIAHTHSVIEKADKSMDEVIANVKATAVSLKAAVEDFKVIASDTKALVATNRGNMAITLQNFHEMSDHLLALSKEVQRAPWRLFATPDKKEVESLNLYDSARAFAAAAADLDSVADTLQIMMKAKEQGVAVDPKILQGMADRLDDTFKKYKEAEDALLKEFDRIQK